jgi:hypothetical protein
MALVHGRSKTSRRLHSDEITGEYLNSYENSVESSSADDIRCESVVIKRAQTRGFIAYSGSHRHTCAGQIAMRKE